MKVLPDNLLMCVPSLHCFNLFQVPRLNLDMTPFKEAKLPIIWVLGQ